MKKGFIAAFFIWSCFLLQSTVFQGLSFNGIVPDLMVIVTASYGFMKGEDRGIIVGLFCGLLCDIFFGEVIGFYALILMYIGYINGKFSGGFYPDDIKLPMILIVLSDLTYCMTCYVFQFLVRGKFDFPYYFSQIIIPEMIYTTVVTIFLYPLILIADYGIKKKEKKGGNKFV